MDSTDALRERRTKKRDGPNFSFAFSSREILAKSKFHEISSLCLALSPLPRFFLGFSSRNSPHIFVPTLRLVCGVGSTRWLKSQSGYYAKKCAHKLSLTPLAMEIDMAALQVRDVLPPELLHRIIRFTFDATEEYILDGQMKAMNSICRTCLLKSLSVAPILTSIATEAFISQIVVGGQEEMENTISLLTIQPRLGQFVRSLDASLRTFEKHSPASEWPVSHTERGEELRMSSADRSVLSYYASTLADPCRRDRQLLLELFKLCPALTNIDIDLGFHNKVSPLFPSTIRSLTLRNSEAKNTLTIVNSLPNLTDLCLRLVLCVPRATSSRADD